MLVISADAAAPAGPAPLPFSSSVMGLLVPNPPWLGITGPATMFAGNLSNAKEVLEQQVIRKTSKPFLSRFSIAYLFFDVLFASVRSRAIFSETSRVVALVAELDVN